MAIDVTVNATAITTEQGAFYTEVDFSPSGFTYPGDSDVARYENISIEAQKSGGTADEVARFSADIYLPPHPEAFVNDADGNLEYDGQWDYSWDAENRLIAMETRAIAYIAGAPRQKLEFAYDSQGRRFNKKVYDWDGSDYQLTEELVFIYDGWNLIAELNNQTSPFTVHTSYLWGLDLSGSLQGAGGVGGLLAVSDENGSTTYPTYDANGNVMGYYAADTGESSAEFEYGPFGELIRATGSKADAFSFRFSTKYEDSETGLLYYGYRYYDAETGRWLSRDPIGENGGLNLYGMVNNDPVNFWDYLGLRRESTFVRNRRIQREFERKQCIPCKSGRWIGSGSVSKLQFNFGVVEVAGTYVCVGQEDELTASILGRDILFGFAAGASISGFTQFETIEGVENIKDLKGQIVVKGTTIAQAGIDLVVGSAEVSLDTNDALLAGGGDSTSITGTVGALGFKGGVQVDDRLNVDGVGDFNPGIGLGFEVFNQIRVTVDSVR